MFYREAGQFKTNYAADSAIFPIRQDRIAMVAILVVAFIVIPLTASTYLFSAILIPFLILSLAALGLNILTGYAGQLSLGSAAFMAVALHHNFAARCGICCWTPACGGCPGGRGHRVRPVQVRIRGSTSAVATRAAQSSPVA